MPEWRWLQRLRLRLRTLLQRDRVEHELDEEFQFHIDERTAFEVARGLSPKDARIAAIRAMDGALRRKDECRDMRRTNFVDDFRRDLRYAAHSLRRSPGFAALAVFIMALGVGANTAVFSVVNKVLLTPLSYRDPDRIATLSTSIANREAVTPLGKQVSIPDFQDWHDQSSAFEAMSCYVSRESPVVIGTEAEYARVARVSPEFFRVFTVDPILGRFFTPEEMKPGAAGAVLVSHAFWLAHFGGDVRVLGRPIRALGLRSIVGVLPPGFRFPGNTDLWVPLVPGGPGDGRGGQNYLAVRS